MLADAIERGRAYLDAGASTFFVPGMLDEPTVAALVEALGPQKVNMIARARGRSPLETDAASSASPGCRSGRGARTSPSPPRRTSLAEVYAGGGAARGHAQAQLTQDARGPAQRRRRPPTTPTATPVRISAEARTTRRPMGSPSSSRPPTAAMGGGDICRMPDCTRLSRGSTEYQSA